MGRRGPPPKPTNVRLLHGDRKDRINLLEPLPRPDDPPEPPPGMGTAALAVWDETVAQLVAMGTAASADRYGIACYVEAVVNHQRATELLRHSDILIKALHGDRFIRNPLLVVQRDAANTIRQWAQELGLTPSARSGIRVGERPRDTAERLLS
jgi:P27 family predicted phage terminase small subunit